MKHQERLEALVRGVIGRVGVIGPDETATHLPREIEKFVLKVARKAWAESRRRAIEECVRVCAGAESDLDLDPQGEQSANVLRSQGARECAERLNKLLRTKDVAAQPDETTE